MLLAAGCSGGSDGGGDAGADAGETAPGDAADGEPVPEGEKLTVGWIFRGPADTEAVGAVEQAFPDRIQTVVEESVVDPGTAATDLAAQGARLVVSTVPDACDAIPETHCVEPGGNPGSNAVVLDDGWWNRAYLVGRAAGLLSETDTIGYIPAPGSPEEIGAVNAFALGCQSANPNCIVRLPAAADPAKAVKQLRKQHADVIATAAENPKCDGAGEAAVQPLAQLGDPCGSAFLVVDAAAVAQPYVQAELDGGFQAGTRAALPLGEWASAVAADVRKKVEDRAAEIEGGRNVFVGPLFDNRGNEQVPEGDELTPEFVAGEWDWLLGGVLEQGG